MDKLSIRKEAARIAAQVEGVTTRNFTATARRIEHYIMGSAKLPEQYNEEDVIRQTIHEAMLKMTGANDAIRKFKEMDKEFHEKYKEFALPQDNVSKTNENTAMAKNFRQCQMDLAEANHYMENMIETQNLEKYLRETLPDTPLSKCMGEMYTPPAYHVVNRQHDPAFVNDLMKTFANYPATKEDFNQAVRRRHELYHDLGLEPEPFDKRHPHPPCDTGQETVYLAPGGMPSSEAESIYLQENGDKVE